MLEENQSSDSGIGDTQEEFTRFAPLSECLKSCADILLKRYAEADTAAQRHQKLHRILTYLAVVFGTIAVMLAVLQLTGLVPSHLPMWLEVFAAAIALCAVILGLIQSRQTSWLLQRHIAERYRLLKFQALIDPQLWTTGSDYAAWEQRLKHKAAEISRMTGQTLHEWMEERGSIEVPPGIAQCHIDDNALSALTSYFREKRLQVQMRYFDRRAKHFHGVDRYLRNLPPLLFFLSILVVFAHFALDALVESESGWHGVSTVLVALAVLLPVLGAGIRSVRSAHEFSRSASLYRAKFEALKRIDDRLNENPDCEQTLHALWHVEQFLEGEHREWLRLLSEAEWFG